MAIHELYWIPPAIVGCWGWVWVCRNWRAVHPIRWRALIGLAGLAVATMAFLCMVAAVLYSWINARFDWLTPFDGWGVLLSVCAVVMGVIATGRLRFFATSSALLSLLGWIAFILARRVPLLA